jgi:hypothetical protein
MSATRVLVVFAMATVILAAGPKFSAFAAAPPPNPCKLVTVPEMQQIVGPLKEAPTATDPSTGEISCTFRPSKGLNFVEISLHDGDLTAWKRRNGGKNPEAASEFGSGSFVTPDFEGFAELYAKKEGLVLRVSAPKGAQSVEVVKAIARKALPRL